MRTTSVRPKKLYEQIADQLEDAIREGDFYESGCLPSERELMKQFNVGRPSIREALFHLRKMGLVEVRSGARARVTVPTPQFVIDTLSGTARHMIAASDGVRNFQNARMFFEVGLVRDAALNSSDEDRARLELALEDNRKSIGDLKLFERTDVAFHYVLALIPDNPIFTAIHAALAEWLLEQRQTTLAPGEDTKAYEAHRAIFKAVSSGDPDQSEQAMREHLEHVMWRYSKIVESQG